MSDSHATAEQLSRLIDGDLPLTERAAVLHHLAGCPSCAGEQARLVDVSAALRSAPAAHWTDLQTDALVTRLRTETTAPFCRRGPAPARSRPLAPIATAAVTLTFLVAFVIAIPVGPLVAGGIWESFAWLPPIGATSAPGAGLVLLAVTLLAPLVAYPLARWR
jgi:anti-sigma factor RsiW